MDYMVERVKEITKEAFANSGLVLVELKMFRRNRDVILRFLVDRPEGGVTIEECAQLNQQISEALDTSQLLQARHVLEVSSPGVDRPLVSAGDFMRCTGRQARVFLKSPVQEKTELIGIIQKVDGETITFAVDPQPLDIPLSNIIKAKQIV